MLRMCNLLPHIHTHIYKNMYRYWAYKYSCWRNISVEEIVIHTTNTTGNSIHQLHLKGTSMTHNITNTYEISTLSFILHFSVWTLLPTHCRCRGLLLRLIALRHTPHSVGLLLTSDQPVAETSTWHHTTFTTDRHPCPGGIRTLNPKKRAVADPRLKTARPLGSALSLSCVKVMLALRVPWRGGAISALIIKLSTRGWCEVRFTLWPL
jgi:hypothetical protein